MIFCRVPIFWQLVRLKEAYFATFRLNNVCIDHTFNTRVLGLRQGFRNTILAVRKAILLEASAFVPRRMARAPRSVRIGQVPVSANPARITASRNVSQPVLAVPASVSVSDCLKA